MLNRFRAGAALFVLAVLAVLAIGCGVPLQDEPAPLRSTLRPSQSSTEPGGAYSVRVYLVRDGRLTPATRTTDAPSAAAAVDILVDGPTELEKVNGTSTAIVPGSFAVEPPSAASGAAVVIDVPAEFTRVAGDLQLLATAQLVWTVTELRPAGAVRMTFGGETIELPTDRGLTGKPVRRTDFMSVAPVDSSPFPS